MDKQQQIATAYRAYRDECIGFIRKHYRFSEQETEDSYQEVWAWILEKAKNIPDLTNEGNKAWLYQKINWTCLNRLRGGGRYRKHIEIWSDRKYPAKFSSKDMETFEQAHDMAIAYNDFNLIKRHWGDRCQELFKLYYVSGYSIKEIAQFKEQSPQTIKNNLKTCRDNIKKILKEIWNQQ